MQHVDCRMFNSLNDLEHLMREVFHIIICIGFFFPADRVHWLISVRFFSLVNFSPLISVINIVVNYSEKSLANSRIYKKKFCKNF